MKNLLTRIGKNRDLFESFEDLFQIGDLIPLKQSSYPKVNLSSTTVGGNVGIKLEASLPGMKKEDVEVVYEDSVLTLRGNTKNEKQDTNENFSIRELHKSSFLRAFRVGVLDEDTIKCSFEDGMLLLEANLKDFSKNRPKNLLA